MKLLADLCIERISAQLSTSQAPRSLPQLNRLPADLQQKLLSFSIRRKSLRDQNIFLFLAPHVSALHLEVSIDQYSLRVTNEFQGASDLSDSSLDLLSITCTELQVRVMIDLIKRLSLVPLLVFGYW